MILVGLLVVGVLALVLQRTLPPLFGQVQPHLVALVIIYAAYRLRDARVFLLTVMLGLIMDLLSLQNLGSSTLTLSLLAGFVLLQPWDNPRLHFSMLLLMVLIGTFFYRITDYLLYSAQAGRWKWTFGLSTRMVFDSILNAFLALLFYPVGNWWIERGTVHRRLR
jgi:rod shape-determining protein MreD